MHLRSEDARLIIAAERCRALASVIAGIPITPSRQRKIDGLNILRAVRGTTGIEGAQLSEEEVEQIMGAPASEQVLPASRAREEAEARNATELMHYVARLLNRYPNTLLTEDLIRKLHAITTGGIDYPGNIPGQYRTSPVRAGSYVPPRDGDDVRRLMEEFVRWFNEGPPALWDPVARAIVAHFYVVSIHPFVEGNGRTSRAVESFLLYKAGINARGFYSLANFYYQNRDEYVDNLDKTRFQANGDLTPFVLFALDGLVRELGEVHAEVLLEVRRIAFRDLVREVLQEKLTTKAGDRMLKFMFGLGDDTVKTKDIRLGQHPLTVLYRGLNERTLSRDINDLKRKGLIVQDKGSIRANLEVMGVFTAPHELTRP